MSIEEIIITFTYLGIIILMTTNGFISFPSSQILYIISGYFVFTGDLSLALVLLFGAFGNTVGNYILYEIARQKGLKYILKFKIFPEKALRKAIKTFEKKGYFFLFIGKILPAIKVFIPIPAGLSKMNRIWFTFLIFISSIIWAFIFVMIGYFFGKSSDIFGYYAPILLMIAFVVIFVFYKMMNSKEIVEEIEKKI